MARSWQRFRIAYVAAAIALPLAGPGAAAALGAPQKSVHHAKAHHQAKAVHHKARVAHHKARVAHHSGPAAAPVTPAPAAPSVREAAPATATSCADANQIPTGPSLGAARAAALCLVNLQRVAAGVPALRETAGLDAAAQGHSDDMVARDYYDHVGPTGLGLLDRVLAAGYAAVGSVLGLSENLAAGMGILSTPAATVAKWMADPQHRANILDASFTDFGVGVTAGVPPTIGIGSAGATYTMCFAQAG